MDEMKGTACAIEALGNVIAQLKNDLYYEGMRRDNAEKRAAQLESENESLTKKLRAVENYIAKEE